MIRRVPCKYKLGLIKLQTFVMKMSRPHPGLAVDRFQALGIGGVGLHV